MSIFNSPEQIHIFVELADHIDEIYGSGINKHHEESAFVKIFHVLLSEKEAETALLLSSSFEEACQISERTGISEEDLARYLEMLSRKGVIYEHLENEVKFYRLLPFVPGILESLVKVSTNPEIAGYLQEYAEEMEHYKQEYTQSVIPVNCKINVQVQHATLREIETYINNTDKYAVMDCICRTIQSARGSACGHPVKDMCLILGDYAEFYVRMGNAKPVSKQEVYDILQKAEEEGLYHELYPIEKNKSTFLCNCCTCGCMFMGLANRINRVIAYQAAVRIMDDRCTRCGKCMEECPEGVFSWGENHEVIEINSEKCFQCGWCSIFCENHAIEWE